MTREKVSPENQLIIGVGTGFYIFIIIYEQLIKLKGPRIVVSGIWKNVYLESWDEAKIDYVGVNVEKIDYKI